MLTNSRDPKNLEVFFSLPPYLTKSGIERTSLWEGFQFRAQLSLFLNGWQQP